MANRWLHAGWDLQIPNVRQWGGAVYYGNTNLIAGYNDFITKSDSGYGLRCDFIDSAGAPDSVVAGEVLWVMMYITDATNSTNGTNLIELANASDQPWIAIRSFGSATNNFGLFYNSGTGASPVWTQIGTAAAGLGMWVIRLAIDAGGNHNVQWYVDEVLVAGGNFTQASLTSIHNAAFRGHTGNDSNISHIACSVGYSLIGARVFTGIPNAAGSNSGMSGAYTTIDDTTSSPINDGDYLVSNAAGQRSTFNFTNLPALPSNFLVGDIFLNTRVRNDGVGPLNCAPVWRFGGVDTVGTAFSGVASGWTNHLNRFSGKTEAEYNAAEFGVESAA